MPASVAGEHGHGEMPMASTTAGMSEGTVTKLDPGQGRITIVNGPPQESRHARQRRWLSRRFVGYARQVKPVTPQHFVAENVSGTMTVTRLENAQ